MIGVNDRGGHLPDKIARQYARDPSMLDALRLVAVERLAYCIETYEPSRGSFSRYATRELRRAVARAADRAAT